MLRRNAPVAASLRELLGPVDGDDPNNSQAIMASESVDPSLSGIAIDQFIRFECQRRAPRHTHVGLVDLGCFDVYRFRMSVSYESPRDGSLILPKKYGRMVKVVDQLYLDASRELKRFKRLRRPTERDFRRVAELSVRLAALENTQAGEPVSIDDIKSAKEEVVSDVLAMVEKIPSEGILGFPLGDGLWLNPNLGRPYSLITAAIPDLVIGDTVVDIKSTGTPSFPHEAAQVVAYALILNGVRDGLQENYLRGAGFLVDRTPEIRRVGIYWARFGVWQSAPLHYRPGDPAYQKTVRELFRLSLSTLIPSKGQPLKSHEDWWWLKHWRAAGNAGFRAGLFDLPHSSQTEHSVHTQLEKMGEFRSEADMIEAALNTNPYTAPHPEARTRPTGQEEAETEPRRALSPNRAAEHRQQVGRPSHLMS